MSSLSSLMRIPRLYSQNLLIRPSSYQKQLLLYHTTGFWSNSCVTVSTERVSAGYIPLTSPLHIPITSPLHIPSPHPSISSHLTPSYPLTSPLHIQAPQPSEPYHQPNIIFSFISDSLGNAVPSCSIRLASLGHLPNLRCSTE